MEVVAGTAGSGHMAAAGTVAEHKAAEDKAGTVAGSKAVEDTAEGRLGCRTGRCTSEAADRLSLEEPE